MENLIKLNELVKRVDLELVMSSSDNGGLTITKKEWKVKQIMLNPICTSVKVQIDYNDNEIILSDKYSRIMVSCLLDEEEDTIRIIRTLFSPLSVISDENLVFLLNNLNSNKNRRVITDGSKIIITNRRANPTVLASLNRSTVDEMIRRNRINDIFNLGNMRTRCTSADLLASKLFDIGLREKCKKSVKAFKIPVSINSNIKLVIMPVVNGTVIVSVVVGKHLKRLSNVYLYSEDDMDAFVESIDSLLKLTGVERVMEMINTLTPATLGTSEGRFVMELYDNTLMYSIYDAKNILNDISAIMSDFKYVVLGSGTNIMTHPSPKSKTVEDIETERKERLKLLGSV